MKALDKPSVIMAINVGLLVIGSLIVTATAATFKNVYSEQDHISEKLSAYIKLDNERDKMLQEELEETKNRLNEFNVTLHEVLVAVKWQKEQLSDIESIVKEIRDRSN